MSRIWWYQLLALGTLVGCAVPLDEEQVEEITPGALRVERVSERCIVEEPLGISRGAAFTLAFDQGEYWIYGETWDDSGPGLRVLGSSATLVSQGADPCIDAQNVRDTEGRLLQLLEPTEEELARLAASNDDRALRLWPVGGFVHAGQGYVYYQKALVAGVFDVTVVGVGIARLSYGGVGQRVRVARYGHDPFLLWAAPDLGWGSGAWLAPDGFAYVYGCHRAGASEHVCRVGRVRAAHAGDARAYAYWTGTEWSPDAERAVAVLERLPGVSVAYNGHLGRFLAIHGRSLDDHLLGRAGRSPWGPFDEARQLLTGTRPENFWISGVQQHPAYERAEGRTLLLSYHTRPAQAAPGLRLVEVHLR